MLFNLDSWDQLLGRDLLAFLPEILLCCSIILLLVLRLFASFDRIHLGWVALFCMAGLLAISVMQWSGQGLSSPEEFQPFTRNQEPKDGPRANMPLGFNPKNDNHPHNSGVITSFSHLLVYDRLALFLRLFLLTTTGLIIWLSLITGIPDREDSGDFYILLFGATLGMLFMVSANHLLMIYLALEMASLASYALAGFLKGRRLSSEAALKYVVYGAGASGIMLYGISLIAGRFGTGYLPDVAGELLIALEQASANNQVLDPSLILGFVLLSIGVAFKLAAFPFHFWCPDVFEGAAAEVAGFLSVASKGAALALLARVTLTLAGLDPTNTIVAMSGMRLAHYLIPTLAILAGLTATFGNLAAYSQTNLKRLLAYSSIAHSGYMIMGLATLTRAGMGATLFYLVAYLFMNLGAFAIVAFLRNAYGSEDLQHYRGLIRRSPFLVIPLSVFLLSLLGVPPLVGFAAKFNLFLALFESARIYHESGEQHLATILLILLVVAALNTVIAAYYYLKVLRVLILERKLEDIEGKDPILLSHSSHMLFYAASMAFIVVIMGVLFNPILRLTQASVERFANRPPYMAEGKP